MAERVSQDVLDEREPPSVDDKILSDWEQMATALAYPWYREPVDVASLITEVRHLRARVRELEGDRQQKETAMKKSNGRKDHRRYCVIGNEGYGLYCGYVNATDDQIVKQGFVSVEDCRHIRYWYGGNGGITSLAAWGPCGSRAKDSRIGAPCPASLITQVRAVHECTPEAVANFAAIMPTR